MHYMHPARSKPLKIPNLRQASSLSSPVCLVLETHLAVELQVLLDNQTRKEFSQMSLMRYSFVLHLSNAYMFMTRFE